MRQQRQQQRARENFVRLMACLKDDEPDLEEARRLLSDPALRWSHRDFDTPDEEGLLPVTHAILSGDADLVRRFYEHTKLLSRNGDGVHPYDVIEMSLKALRGLRQNAKRTQQQTRMYQNLLAAEEELLAMQEYVGGRWLPILGYLRRHSRHRTVSQQRDTERNEPPALQQAWMDVVVPPQRSQRQPTPALQQARMDAVVPPQRSHSQHRHSNKPGWT